MKRSWIRRVVRAVSSSEVTVKGKEDSERNSEIVTFRAWTLSSPMPMPLTMALGPRRETLIMYCRDDWGCE
jgi:hypothetical protein